MTITTTTTKKQTHKYREQTVITSAENEEEGQDRGRKLRGTKWKKKKKEIQSVK